MPKEAPRNIVDMETNVANRIMGRNALSLFMSGSRKGRKKAHIFLRIMVCGFAGLYIREYNKLSHAFQAV